MTKSNYIQLTSLLQLKLHISASLYFQSASLWRQKLYLYFYLITWVTRYCRFRFLSADGVAQRLALFLSQMKHIVLIFRCVILFWLTSRIGLNAFVHKKCQISPSVLCSSVVLTFWNSIFFLAPVSLNPFQPPVSGTPIMNIGISFFKCVTWWCSVMSRSHGN